jgi:hypothetical protein
MSNPFEERRRKNYILMRMVYDIGMSVLLIGMSVIMLFGSYWGIDKILAIDNIFRYMFGGICLLYGAFRLYRGIKRDY